jgi:hypothetical protein
MRVYGLGLCLLLVISAGCGKKDVGVANKPLVTLRGVITVNGEVPEWPILLTFVSTSGMDEANPTVTSAKTDENGNFEASTYDNGDGIPAGSYAMTATAIEYNTFLRRPMGPDKLGGRYDKAQKSPKKFEVKDGDQPMDLGTIDLVGPKKKKK